MFNLYSALICLSFTAQPKSLPAAESGKPLGIKEIQVTDARCYNQTTGSAEIVATGGQAPYQYSLDGKIFQSKPLFKFLKAGNYRVYLKDAVNHLYTSTFTVNQPPRIHFLPTRTTNSGCCNPNGAVLVEAQGGTGTFQYQINESSFQASGYFSGLAGGYTVVAMDSVGCRASLVVKVDDFSGPIIDFLNSTEVSCHDGQNGSITVYSVGGSGQISYSIDGGKKWQKESQFNALKAGSYLVRIKDETGCSDSAQLVISQPPVLEVSAVSHHRANTGDSYSIEVKYSIGGTGTHYYSLNETDYQTSPLFHTTGTKELIYIKDMAGCTAQARIGSTEVSMKKK